VEPSREASDYLTMKEAAQNAGCSESTIRRLVKASEVPFLQEETAAGFRYLFRADDIPLIAHKATMRRPRGRRVEGPSLQPSSMSSLQEASTLREELAAVKTERDMLRTENSRLWSQVERLTESVTRLALPERATSPEPPAPQVSGGLWGGLRDWFLGRGGREDE
jgi:excisionase family DNA binding protein